MVPLLQVLDILEYLIALILERLYARRACISGDFPILENPGFFRVEYTQVRAAIQFHEGAA
jgi:hypothetical protein